MNVVPNSLSASRMVGTAAAMLPRLESPRWSVLYVEALVEDENLNGLPLDPVDGHRVRSGGRVEDFHAGVEIGCSRRTRRPGCPSPWCHSILATPIYLWLEEVAMNLEAALPGSQIFDLRRNHDSRHMLSSDAFAMDCGPASRSSRVPLAPL